MAKVDEKAKKNCMNCECLDYYEADYESFDSSGFYCSKRQENMERHQEREFLRKLEDAEYREKSKKMF